MARSKRSTEPLTLGALPARGAGARYILAYSGGLDSTVLLHLLARSRLPRLTAVHVHHGLQAAADDWAAHCRAQCRRLKLPFKLLRVAIDPRAPEGPEAAARNARYAALRVLMRRGDCLVTAHQADDQAETVLLRILRGTGIDGLAAMRPVTPFGPGILWRPLLDYPRADLRAEVERLNLQWIEDPHNRDSRFARSRLRHELMPRIQAQWPQAADSLRRLAWNAAEAADMLQALAEDDLAQVARGAELSLQQLCALPPARQRNLLRAWLELQGQAAPAAQTLQRLQREVLRARPDASPLLRLGDHEVRRYRDRLLLMPALPPAPAGETQLAWNGSGTLELPESCGRLRLVDSCLRWQEEVGRGARGATLDLCVRFPRGGERLKPACGGPTRTLKNLFQEAGVPPWVRQRAPLIYERESLRCVADYWCDHDWAGRGLTVVWDVDLPGKAMRDDRRSIDQ